jgi:hypothetical protein
MNKRQFKAYSLEGHIYGHVEKIPQDNRGVIIVSRSPPDMMAQNIHDAIVHAKKHKSVRPPTPFPAALCPLVSLLV